MHGVRPVALCAVRRRWRPRAHYAAASGGRPASTWTRMWHAMRRELTPPPTPPPATPHPLSPSASSRGGGGGGAGEGNGSRGAANVDDLGATLRALAQAVHSGSGSDDRALECVRRLQPLLLSPALSTRDFNITRA